MKVRIQDKDFKPITIEITFEAQSELNQLRGMLENSDEQLNSLVDEKIDFRNDNWVDTLHNTLKSL